VGQPEGPRKVWQNKTNCSGVWLWWWRGSFALIRWKCGRLLFWPRIYVMVSGRHVVAPKCSKVGKTIVLHSIFIWAWLKKWSTRKIAWFEFHIPQMANKLWVRYHPNDLNRSHVRILNLSLWHKWPREETPHPWLQLQWPRGLIGDLRWYTQCHKPPICRVHTTHLWSYWGWFTIEVTTLPDDHVKNTGYQYTLYIYIYL